MKNKEYYAEWYQRNKQQQNAYYADYREKMKLEMVKAYGGECVACGENDPIILLLDHIHDNAQEDRVINKHTGGNKLYRQLRAKGWPQGQYQLMCHNCNYRKEYFRRHIAAEERNFVHKEMSVDDIFKQLMNGGRSA